jgi:hypothetical protein
MSKDKILEALGVVHIIRNAIFQLFRPLSSSPFVTKNSTNPYIFKKFCNKSLTPLLLPRALRILWTTPYYTIDQGWTTETGLWAAFAKIDKKLKRWAIL